MQVIGALKYTLPILLLTLWISTPTTSYQVRSKRDTTTPSLLSTETSSTVNTTTSPSSTEESITVKTITSQSLDVTKSPKVATSTFPPLVHSLHDTKQESPKNTTRPPLTNSGGHKDDQAKSTTLSPLNNGINSTTTVRTLEDRFGSGSTFPPLIHVISQSPSSSEDEQKEPTISTSIEMGRCPWAILGCCTNMTEPKSTVEYCLEFLGCAGPFWDKKPCDASFVNAAIEFAYQRHKDGHVRRS